MSNCMKNIAEGLGVKLNEVFLIDDDKYMIRDYFRITENDLEHDFRRQFSSSSWSKADNRILALLVTGRVEITKLPWTPKKDEIYYTPFVSGESLFTSYAWRGDDVDRANLKKGVVCRTSKEATKMTKKMLAAIKEK